MSKHIDLVTMLVAARDKRCTKLWKRDGRKWSCDDYDCGKWFAHREVRVDTGSGVNELHALLLATSRHPRCMLIHGVLRDGHGLGGVVRRTSAERPGDEDRPYFRDSDRRWVMLDVDCGEWPTSRLPADQAEAEAAARHNLSLIPESMRDADCVVQLSSSAGFKRGKRFSAHYFYCLDQATCCSSWHAWIRAHCLTNPMRRRGTKPIFSLDPAVQRPVQPLFVAAPLVTGGVDPLLRRGIDRIFVLRGSRRLASPPEGVTTRAGYKLQRRLERERMLARAAEREREYLERYGALSPDQEAERVRDALMAIPAGDRHLWWRLGMALKAWDEVRGRALWDAWSAPDPRFSASGSDTVWSSMRGSGLTIATVFWEARNAGWRPPRRKVEHWRGYHG
jgi:hypothetical protein